MVKSKQFTHRMLPLVLCRAFVTDDKRTTCRLNAMLQTGCPLVMESHGI